MTVLVFFQPVFSQFFFACGALDSLRGAAPRVSREISNLAVCRNAGHPDSEESRSVRSLAR